MNSVLLEQIVLNIFANLLVIPSDFVDQSSKSIKSKEFLLKEKLSFEVDGATITRNIWGCQISTGDQELKILLGDCSQDDDLPEYCLIVQLKDAPAYGAYLVYNNSGEGCVPGDALIACALNENDWLICNTYLQATFLAGMEQIKDVGLSWNRCTNYKHQVDIMKSFVKYHNAYYEEEI